MNSSELLRFEYGMARLIHGYRLGMFSQCKPLVRELRRQWDRMPAGQRFAMGLRIAHLNRMDFAELVQESRKWK